MQKLNQQLLYYPIIELLKNSLKYCRFSPCSLSSSFQSPSFFFICLNFPSFSSFSSSFLFISYFPSSPKTVKTKNIYVYLSYLFPLFSHTHTHNFDLNVTDLIISCSNRQGDKYYQLEEFMHSAINLFDRVCIFKHRLNVETLIKKKKKTSHVWVCNTLCADPESI